MKPRRGSSTPNSRGASFSETSDPSQCDLRVEEAGWGARSLWPNILTRTQENCGRVGNRDLGPQIALIPAD